MTNQTIIAADGILSTIGHTPLVHLKKLFPHFDGMIYGKLEAFNPAGSIKDRTAHHIIQKGVSQGKINGGTTIIESTSGNMGIGLAQCCLSLGLKLKLVVDPYINAQAEKILKAYGAEIVKVTDPDDTGGYLNARINKVGELLASTRNSFWPNQYGSHHNPEAHHQTMEEILDELYGNLDYIFIATSTCGTLMGCAEKIYEGGYKTKIIPVDSEGSIIFGGTASKRLIPGFGAGRPSQFLNTHLVEKPMLINEPDSIKGARMLLKREAILAGGSSGAVVMAIQKMLPHISPDATIACIICDRGERYLDTIYSDTWVEENYGKETLDFISMPDNPILS
ncbi:2,3-diaminopropionate biosynthesis protein SbnA [Anditalea andensis]|uniref:N-(2-amino-2-carboxyethyl)-L-glutamate synthase n=1 Tax=Anditalea andensis TaxID=1048983 RepID=A0A074LIE6_9BACT|nr:2,3-diaminopropionate biosynthesis protein SbnA [Anditalea andensis]KEO73547.1 hypothetical protein EL17_11645 [Anditalea andensis]